MRWYNFIERINVPIPNKATKVNNKRQHSEESKRKASEALLTYYYGDDKELYEVLKIQNDIKFKYDVVIEFVNGENKLEFNSTSLDVDK